MGSRIRLTEVRRLAKQYEGHALVEWYSTLESDDRFVNLRNIRLIVVVHSTVHLMPGTVTRTKDGDQQLLFASKGLCRIRNGKRRGMIIEPDRLRVGEDAGGTGLVKPLTNDLKFNSFHMNDDRDRAVIDRLYDAFGDFVDLDDIVLPDTYIRGRSADNLVMRLSGDVTKQLMNLPHYDRSLNMEDNFHNLIGVFSVEEGGYTLYPFHMVQGTGMVVVDVETLPPPLLIPLGSMTKENNLLKVLL